VSLRDGDQLICPHCNTALADKDIYKDCKGWTFCRSCFRKGRGAILLPPRPEKRATFLFEHDCPDEPLAKEGQRTLWSPNRPVDLRSRKPADRQNKDMTAFYQAGPAGELSSPGGLPPEAYLLPAGLVGEAVLGETLPRGLLRGLLTGGGAAAGGLLANHATSGDIGSRLTGSATGGALGYLLSRYLLPEEKQEEKLPFD